MRPEYQVEYSDGVLWWQLAEDLKGIDADLVSSFEAEVAGVATAVTRLEESQADPKQKKSHKSRRTKKNKHQACESLSGSPTVSGLGDLPPYSPMSSPVFLWGEREAKCVITEIDEAFEKIVVWRKNVFKLPSNHSGKHFTQELSRLFLAFAEKSPLECIALKAAA